MTGQTHTRLHAIKPYIIAILVVFGVAGGLEGGVDLTLKWLGL